MKIRIGFVANSSSSSFICNNNAKFSIGDVKNILVNIFELYKIVVTAKRLDFSETFEEMFEEPFIVGNETCDYVKHIWSWKKADKDCFGCDPFYGIKNKKDLIGKLIINSAGDNAIPCEFFEFIEYVFDGKRVHLG